MKATHRVGIGAVSVILAAVVWYAGTPLAQAQTPTETPTPIPDTATPTATPTPTPLPALIMVADLGNRQIPQSGRTLQVQMLSLGDGFYEGRLWLGFNPAVNDETNAAVSGWNGVCGMTVGRSPLVGRIATFDWNIRLAACDAAPSGVTVSILWAIGAQAPGPTEAGETYYTIQLVSGTFGEVEILAAPEVAATPTPFSMAGPVQPDAFIVDQGELVGNLVGVDVGTALALIASALALLAAVFVGKWTGSGSASMLAAGLVLMACVPLGLLPIWGVAGVAILGTVSFVFYMFFRGAAT